MNYWLMKSEPNVFGIDHLARSPGQKAPWDGVRNYQVRNWLRDEIKVGDLAFFYHSSCAEPAIVGIVKVVRAGYPDKTAFDSSSPYFDPKSDLAHPRWYCVDVSLVRKFKHPITLQSLRQCPELQEMPLLKKGNRLSIVPVTRGQWDFIMKLI